MADYKKFSASEGRKTARTVNLALKVSEFVEQNGEVLVKGTSLESGEEIMARLGETENAKRPTLAHLRDGRKVNKIFRKMEPGGVLVLDKASRPEGEKIFTANWPSVMAYSAADAEKNVMNGLCSLCVGTNKDGKNYGYVLRHATDPGQFIDGKSPDELYTGIRETTARCARQSFTIRAIKDDGKVVAVGQVLSNWNAEEKRAKPPEETASTVAALAQKMQKAYPGTTLSVIPAIRYSVTTFMLDDADRFERLQKVANTFKQQEQDKGDVSYLAKKVCLKLGGEHHEFINDFKVMDPYAPGIDPAYIAGLIPAHDEAPHVEDLNEAHVEEQHVEKQTVTPPAPADTQAPVAETSDDPFAGVPQDDDESPSM